MKRGPKHHVPTWSDTDDDGFAICVWCRKRLRYEFGGYGYEGMAYFCSMKCAATWGNIKVEGTSHEGHIDVERERRERAGSRERQ